MFAHVSVRKLKISLKEALIVSFFIHVVFLSFFQASTMGPWQLWHRLWTLSSLMHFLLTIALFLACIKVGSFIVDLIDHNRRFGFFFICRLMFFFPLDFIKCQPWHLWHQLWTLFSYLTYVLIFSIHLFDSLHNFGKTKRSSIKRNNNNNSPEQSSLWPVPIAALVSQDTLMSTSHSNCMASQ